MTAILPIAFAIIQSVIDVVKQVNAGTITDAQAQAYLTAASSHFRQSVAEWDATKAPGA